MELESVTRINLLYLTDSINVINPVPKENILDSDLVLQMN